MTQTLPPVDESKWGRVERAAVNSPVFLQEWQDITPAIQRAVIIFVLLNMARRMRWSLEPDTVTLTVKRSTAKYYSERKPFSVPVSVAAFHDVVAASRKALA